MERIRIREAVEEFEEAKRNRRMELEGMGLAGAVAVRIYVHVTGASLCLYVTSGGPGGGGRRGRRRRAGRHVAGPRLCGHKCEYPSSRAGALAR